VVAVAYPLGPTRITPFDPTTAMLFESLKSTSARPGSPGVRANKALLTAVRRRRGRVGDLHPVEAEALKASKVGGSALYPGSVASFTDAGFTEIGRTPRRDGGRRAVVGSAVQAVAARLSTNGLSSLRHIAPYRG